MGEDGSTFRLQPLITVSMVEMPVGVEQSCDRILAQQVKSRRKLRA